MRIIKRQKREESFTNQKEAENDPSDSSHEMWTVIDTNGIIFNRKIVKIHKTFRLMIDLRNANICHCFIQIYGAVKPKKEICC